MASVIALIPLQEASWLTLWLTPVWILAVGVLIGVLATAAIYAVFAMLSAIPALGTLAENRRTATIVAMAIAAVVAGIGIFRSVVLSSGDALAGAEPDITHAHRVYLILPMIVFGLIVGWGVVYGVWRRTTREVFQIFSEGILGYLMLALVLFVIGGLAGTMVVTDRDRILSALPQVLENPRWQRQIPLEAAPADLDDPDQAPFQKIDIFDYNSERVSEVRIVSDRTILVADADSVDKFTMSPQRIEADDPVVWRRGKADSRSKAVMPLPLDPSGGVYFQNREIDPATVTVSIITKADAPEALTIWVTAGIIVLLLGSMVTIRQASPQINAIALATAKSELAQPLYITLLLIGGVAIFAFVFVPFNTLGEDIKVLKDSGMTLIMVFSIIQAVWASGTSVSEEIEGRTALTVLSKPITRRSFIIGKYVGIMWTVLLMFVLLGALLMVATAYKPIYDSRENSKQKPAWEVCHREMVTTAPGLCLLFMETAVIASISVAIATRLPVIANFVVCFTIYVIGNLTAPIVRASAEDNELVRFVGRLIAVIVPNLNTFNLQAAVDAGNPIPPIYLAGAFTYLCCFIVVILVVSLLMFEDRDLA